MNMKRHTKNELMEALALQSADMDSMMLQVMLLRDALNDAATSLETINLRSYGLNSFLDSKEQIRGYAGSRAFAAREELKKLPTLDQFIVCRLHPVAYIQDTPLYKAR